LFDTTHGFQLVFSEAELVIVCEPQNGQGRIIAKEKRRNVLTLPGNCVCIGGSAFCRLFLLMRENQLAGIGGVEGGWEIGFTGEFPEMVSLPSSSFC